MFTIEDYNLRKFPFATTTRIKITSKDMRINGKLFYDSHALDEINDLIFMSTIDRRPVVYLRSFAQAYGNGKSALLAHVYWKLINEDYNILWITATENPKIKNLLIKMFESIIAVGLINKVKCEIGNINFINVKKILSESENMYSSNRIKALVKILEMNEEDMANKYANIKRSMPGQDLIDVFEVLIDLCNIITKQTFIIFVDQFEEYVDSHSSARERKTLHAELNDFIRAVGDDNTLVVSTHSRAEIILRSMEIETFSDIVASGVEMPSMEEGDLFNMIKMYLKYYRSKKTKNVHTPFRKNALSYAIHRTGFHPRSLLNSLRRALSFGMRYEQKKIDLPFISQWHSRIFGGEPNQIEEFVNKKWEYTII